MSSGTKMIGVVIAAVVIIGASVWLTRPPATTPPALQESEGHETPAGTSTHGHRTNTLVNSTQIKPQPKVGSSNATTGVPTLIGEATLITDWNEKIDSALRTAGEDRDVAKSLLQLFPRFPAEGQVEALQHISNLLPDEDYPELAKLMEDAKLPDAVLEELMMDLLNRPNKIMLPELLQVAKNSEHPKAGEAKDFLELYLEEDYGTDWNLWQTKLDEWLKANPE